MITHNEISNSISLANRRAAYLVGTSRSVRRGWGHQAPLPTGIDATTANSSVVRKYLTLDGAAISGIQSAFGPRVYC